MSDRITLLSSYNEPDTVEMMDDDESSSESDDESRKSQSNTNDEMSKIKNRSNDEDDDEDDDEEDEDQNNSDDLNKRTNLLNTIMPDLYNNDFKPKIIDPISGEELVVEEEDEERKRFQIELEFVQSLANPNYLNFLAQRGYFRNQTFLNYLKYLMYWKEPDYVKYIMYPQCLSLLELLQHVQFLKEIVNAQCSKFIDEQLLLIWSTYKKKRDWIRIDPTKIPDGIEKLFTKQQQEKQPDDSNDPFLAATFLANEKF